MGDPLIDDFRVNLEPINALAEVSPGYVWRLQDESGNATGIKPFGDDLEIVNLTVWESIPATTTLRSAASATAARPRWRPEIRLDGSGFAA